MKSKNKFPLHLVMSVCLLLAGVVIVSKEIFEVFLSPSFMEEFKMHPLVFIAFILIIPPFVIVGSVIIAQKKKTAIWVYTFWSVSMLFKLINDLNNLLHSSLTDRMFDLQRLTNFALIFFFVVIAVCGTLLIFRSARNPHSAPTH
jgi:hypothetical protein